MLMNGSVWSLCWMNVQFDPSVEWMFNLILVLNECSVWSECWMNVQFDPCVKWMLSSILGYRLDLCWMNSQFHPWLQAKPAWIMWACLLYLMSSNDESDYSVSCWKTLGLTPVHDVKNDEFLTLVPDVEECWVWLLTDKWRIPSLKSEPYVYWRMLIPAIHFMLNVPLYLMLKKAESDSLATALASMVFPFPGGPKSRRPLR